MRSAQTLRLVAVVLLALAAVATFSQTSVTSDAVTRACGSAFDVIADRSGWEDWWAADLDESDASRRELLLRTRECPASVNTRVVLASFSAALAAASLVIASRIDTRRSGSPRAGLESVGTVTFAIGVALTALGVAAIAVLLADSESTLFLYVDRLVVAIIGLIVLVPTISLMVFGRALRLVADRDGRDRAERSNA